MWVTSACISGLPVAIIGQQTISPGGAGYQSKGSSKVSNPGPRGNTRVTRGLRGLCSASNSQLCHQAPIMSELRPLFHNRPDRAVVRPSGTHGCGGPPQAGSCALSAGTVVGVSMSLASRDGIPHLLRFPDPETYSPLQAAVRHAPSRHLAKRCIVRTCPGPVDDTARWPDRCNSRPRSRCCCRSMLKP